MATTERACVFRCESEKLIGILHEPEVPATLGIIIMVGGPQYRIGSHRQFLLLARSWAQAGIPVFRFDCRGMGDSSGDFPGFEHTLRDIAAGVNTFFNEWPALQRIVLWGLCDGTTVVSRYAAEDPRVAGIVLVNPWVRSEAGQARTQLRHYYLQRVAGADFWRKLSRGEFRPGASLLDFARNVRSALFARLLAGSGDEASADTLVERMGAGVQRYGGPVLLILSGKDLTAQEFADTARLSPRWRKIFREQNVTRQDLAAADHTFSRRVWRDQIAQWTRDWVASLN